MAGENGQGKAIVTAGRKGEALTEMQAAFVRAYTSETGSRGNASESARRAGYSPETAGKQGGQLLAKPHIKAAIEAANREGLSLSGAVHSIALLERVVKDEDAPIKVRVQAAIAVLDRSGYGPAGASERKAAEERRQRDAKGRLYSEYSTEELDAEIARILAERHQGPDNAKVIEGTAAEVVEPSEATGSDGEER